MLVFLRSLIFIVLLPSLAGAANLKDAVDIAQANNRNIKLEKIKLDATKTLKGEAMAEFLPNVSANAQYGQRNSHYNGQLYDNSTKQKIQELKVEQPIFDGLHSVSKYREAGYKIQSGDSKTADKIQEISFAAAMSYCNLFRYQEIVASYEEIAALGKEFANLAARRRKLKVIDNAEIIKLNYEVAVLEEKRLDAINRFSKAKIEYQNVVGELHTNLNPPEVYIEEFEPNKILQAALMNNHSIKSSHYNYLASKAAYNAEKSNFSPKVSMTASASKQEKVVYLNNQDLSSRSVFLNVTVPFFQKGVEYSSMNKARYEKDAALEEYEIAKQNISKEVNQALEEYRFFLESSESNRKLYELAQERAEIFDKRMAAKVEDPIEVIRAKIEANDRKVNYINSQIDFIITHYKIKYFLGEI